MKDGRVGGVMQNKISTNDVQIAAENIALHLCPRLRLTEHSALDERGIDGWLDGKSIQIKGDQTIALTGNIYHEIYEKTRGNEQQLWRASPHSAQVWIFITDGFAILTSMNALCLAEIGLGLKKISETSVGFLVPIRKMERYKHTRIEHALWPFPRAIKPIAEKWLHRNTLFPVPPDL